MNINLRHPLSLNVLFMTLLATILASDVNAQGFSYQGVLRDTSNTPLIETMLDVRFTILEDSVSGSTVYEEIHNDIVTSSLGMVHLMVGTGTSPDDFSSIDWLHTHYFLRVAVNVNANWMEMGTSPIGSVPVAEHARVAANGYWVENGTSEIYYNTANVGIGTTDPDYKLDVSGVLRIQHSNNTKLLLKSTEPDIDNQISVRDENEQLIWAVNLMDRSQNNRIGFYSYEAGSYVFHVAHDGTTTVECIDVLDGCDISEGLNSTSTVEPGDVVVMDANRYGEILLSKESYDTKVVGVISGANGVRTGITLSQKGVLEGAHRVALQGRVYVKVTGPVEAGDMLTTSDVSGKAMAAKNRKKAFGAVIGKALEADADGDGMVLMLVQPR